jgi:hypothetical protein
VNVEVEFLPNQLGKLARSHGLAGDELLLDKCQCLVLKLMGTVRSAFSWDQAGDASLVELGL